MRTAFIFAVFLSMLWVGCFTTSKISNKNLSFIYYRDATILHPEFKVFHAADTMSTLYCSIKAKELLYSKEENSSEFRSQYIISYQLYSSFESKDVIDSASFEYVYIKNDNELEIINSFDFKASYANTYLLEVIVYDVKRRQAAKSYINVDKSNRYNRQAFMVNSKIRQQPNFKTYIHQKDVLTVGTNEEEQERVYMSYYNKQFSIAPPPFSVKQYQPMHYQPDSVVELKINDMMKYGIKLGKEGMYHFQKDTITNEGYTAFKYYNGFPKVVEPEQMIAPLKYITTRKEYSEMMLLDNKKLAVDNFWLNITGNPDRGRRVIKKFYSRVQEANKYFTSYLEGWKTDRGMVYIVYGLPDVLYKNSYSENWMYGEEGNLMSLNFTFEKVKNPYSDNDYNLNRSPVYKNSWYLAVDAWRQGIVY